MKEQKIERGKRKEERSFGAEEPGTRVEERGKKRSSVNQSSAKRNEFFQKALAYEKTIAREGGILMPH